MSSPLELTRREFIRGAAATLGAAALNKIVAPSASAQEVPGQLPPAEEPPSQPENQILASDIRPALISPETPFTDSLTAEGLVREWTSPTGKTSALFNTDGIEGYHLTVQGSEGTWAGVMRPVEGLGVSDGVVQLKFRARPNDDGTANPRTRFNLLFRAQNGDHERIAVAMEPARGLLQIAETKPGEPFNLKAQKTGLTDNINLDWNDLTVKLQGNIASVALNGAEVLTTDKITLDGQGGVLLAVSKLGDPNDDIRASVAFKDLEVRGLQGGDPSRLPTYLKPQPVEAKPAPDYPKTLEAPLKGAYTNPMIARDSGVEWLGAGNPTPRENLLGNPIPKEAGGFFIFVTNNGGIKPGDKLGAEFYRWVDGWKFDRNVRDIISERAKGYAAHFKINPNDSGRWATLLKVNGQGAEVVEFVIQ